jgi:ABC-type Fe3+/spermidine/putrescine transport system ATPase subunit
MSDLIAVLDGGVLQQLGKPLEVYQRPANRFVADFLGESNLLEVARWELLDGRPAAVSKRGLATFAASQTAANGQSSAWLIIRPENIGIGVQADALTNRCDGEVIESLYVGDLVKYKVMVEGGDELVVKALASSGEPKAVGSRISLGWRSEHCLPVAA